jgi:ribonuclease P protein component
MTNPRQTFRKQERLCNRKLIETLFRQGHFVFEYPFKVFYLILNDEQKFSGKNPAQILITVPKRQFKKAVLRNYIRRLIKEGYRKNKSLLYDFLEAKKIRLVAALVYVARTPISALETEQKIIKSLMRLTQTIDKSNSNTKSFNHHDAKINK